jgi:hypothetical protein
LSPSGRRVSSPEKENPTGNQNVASLRLPDHATEVITMVRTERSRWAKYALITIAKRAGPDATRRDVVVLYGRLIGTLALRPLESLSALVHRLAPGVRVM